MATKNPLPRRADYFLPWPPSVNHYWRHVGKHVLVSREGRAYRKAVAAEVAAGPGMVQGPVEIWAYFQLPDRRRRDLDNLRKALYDALEGAGAIEDDSCIVADHAQKSWAADAQPGVRVRIRQAEN